VLKEAFKMSNKKSLQDNQELQDLSDHEASAIAGGYSYIPIKDQLRDVSPGDWTRDSDEKLAVLLFANPFA
jgi:hypothetical protein